MQLKMFVSETVQNFIHIELSRFMTYVKFGLIQHFLKTFANYLAGLA